MIRPSGQIACLYDERLPLARLGGVHIRRASQVEPDADGRWWTDLGLSSGPRLGPFALRSQALEAEVAWLETHVLPAGG